MPRYNKFLIFLSALAIVALPSGGICAQGNESPSISNASAQQWEINDTIQSAFSYNPTLKQDKEDIRVAEEGVKQAKAGYLPEINVYTGTGARTVLVPKD